MNIIDVVVDAENRDGGAVKICLVAASRQIDFKQFILNQKCEMTINQDVL